MSTKTIIIGETKSESQKKPIEFVKCLSKDLRLLQGIKEVSQPHEWSYIELICSGYSFKDGLDLMFAYDDPSGRGSGYLYLGKWNDGVVE